MKDEQLRQVMERLAEKAVPDKTSIWDKLESAYIAETKPKRMPPRMNWAAVFVAVLAISLLSTGGALAYFWLNHFPADAGAQNVADAGLGIALNESQTVNGVTIHLMQGYADAERVLLFYTLENVDPTRFNQRAPEASLNEVYNFGAIDEYQNIDGLHYRYNLAEKRVLLVSSFRHTTTDAATVDFTWQLIISDLGEVVPPEFHFDLSLPIAESLLIPVHQTIEADGFPITLESIEISAASSTVTLCTKLPADYDHADFGDMGLLINGELFVYVTEENSYSGADYCLRQSFNAGMLTGTETIEITTSSLYSAATPTQADIDRALAAVQAQGIQGNVTFVDGVIHWGIISQPESMSAAEASQILESYLYSKVEINHTFSVNLSELVLGQR